MLAANPCQAECDWGTTARPALLRCAGCGSEWTRDELWTPAQADGTVPTAVTAALAEEITSARPGAAAGSAGS